MTHRYGAAPAQVDGDLAPVELQEPDPGAASRLEDADERPVGEDADGRDERRKSRDDAMREIGLDVARAALAKIEAERVDTQVDRFLGVPLLGDAADLDHDPVLMRRDPSACRQSSRKFASSRFPARRQDRLGVELHAVERQRLVPHAEDGPIRRVGARFERVGKARRATASE